MNEENLIPFTSEQSREEAVKNGSKGGKASGEARRKKKALKDCMKQLLALPVNNCEQWNDLAALGIAPEDIDNNMLVTVGLFRAAAGGDVKAYREMRHLIGDNETELDRKIKRAQLDKIKAETEEVKRRVEVDDSNSSEDCRHSLIEALRESATDIWEGDDDNAEN